MNAVINTIKNLHSTRKFTPQPIDKESLEHILTAAIAAGNSGNRQVYSIIVVNDRDILKKYFYGGSLGLIFLIDFNRWIDLAKILNINIESSIDGLRGFTISSMDAMLAAQNAALAAKSLGIESLFTTSLHRANMKEVYALFDLPKQYCFPYLSLALGYSDEKPSSNKGRVKEGVIHYNNKYRRLSETELKQQIAEYDDETNHLGSVSMTECLREGYQHYLELYFKKWAKSQPPEEIKGFYQTISDAMFLEIDRFVG
ncbi:MAG: nitroreductase family protein [Candidatus Heimdallarchaeota archaeon]|nr:nitroreductase family protein [Candidatus Heimdallarchaeota archaeon]